MQFYGAQTLLWHVRERYGNLRGSATELFDLLTGILTEKGSGCSRMVKGKLEQVLATLIVRSYPKPDLLTELLDRELIDASVRMRVLIDMAGEVERLGEILPGAQADLKSRLGEISSTKITSLISGTLNQLPRDSLDLFSAWSTSFKSFRLGALPLVRQMLTSFEMSTADLIEGVTGALLTWLDSGVEGLRLILLLPDLLRGELRRVLDHLVRTEEWEQLAILGKVYRLYGELVCDELMTMEMAGKDASARSFIELIINLTLLEVRHATTVDVALFWVAYTEAIINATGPVEQAKEVLGTVLRLLLENLAASPSLGKYEASLGEVYVAIYGALEDRMLRLLLEGVHTGHVPLIRSCCVCFGSLSSYIAENNLEALELMNQVMQEGWVPDRVLLDLLARQGIQRLLESSKTCLIAMVPRLQQLYREQPRATLGVLIGLMGPTLDELVLDWSRRSWPSGETDQLLLWTVLVQALSRLPLEDGRINEAIRMVEERLPSEGGLKMLRVLIERSGPRRDLLLAPRTLQLLQWACQQQQRRGEQRSDAPRHTSILLDLHMTALPIYAQIDEHSTWELYSSLLHKLIVEAGGEEREGRGGNDNGGLVLVREALLVMSTYRGHLADALIKRVLNAQMATVEETLTTFLPLVCRALRGRRRDEFPPSVTELGQLLLGRLASGATMADELLRPLVDCLLLSASAEMAPSLVTNGLRAAQRALTPSQVEILAPLLLEAAQFDARSLASALGQLATDAGTTDLVRKLCACRLPRKFAALLGQLLTLTGRVNLTAST